MIKKFLKRFMILWLVLSFFFAVAAAASYTYVNWPVSHPPVRMSIAGGTSVNEIADVLHSSGVIKSPFAFRLYVMLSGYSSKLRAGDYEFSGDSTIVSVVRKLLKGDFATYMLTIPEGWTVAEIAQYLKTLSYVEPPDFADRFLLLSKDTTFIGAMNIGWPVSGLEGYLFPSTYEVYKLKDPAKLIGIMTAEFRRKFSAEVIAKAPSLGVTPAQVITMASLIEKETARPEERRLVASVFYNRLKKGMLLQCDPTVIYGLVNFDGNLKKSDLANGHKYNTYVHAGLPPAPIANPGAGAIEAALNPAVSDYLYFVAKGDGSHEFTTNLTDHQNAVNKYQLVKIGHSREGGNPAK